MKLVHGYDLLNIQTEFPIIKHPKDGLGVFSSLNFILFLIMFGMVEIFVLDKKYS